MDTHQLMLYRDQKDPTLSSAQIAWKSSPNQRLVCSYRYPTQGLYEKMPAVLKAEHLYVAAPKTPSLWDVEYNKSEI
jgi:hypothetical protein